MNKTIAKEVLFQQVKHKWYAQGFNCTPLQLSGPAFSGFDIKPVLGDNYKKFIWDYKKEYGKMYYNVDDLQRLGKILVKKIKSELNYIQKVRKEDREIQQKSINEVLAVSESNYPHLSDKELYDLFKKAMIASRKVGIISHIIEGFSLTADIEIKEKLEKYVKDSKKLNHYLSLLSTPTERSFIHEREEDLHKISLIKNSKEQNEAIHKHLKDFYWVRNTYAGRVRLTPEQIIEEINVLNYHPIDFDKIQQDKDKALKEWNIDEELKTLLQASAEITSWQDERKKYVFIIIDFIDGLAQEISKRMNIDIKLFRYMTYNEILNETFIKEKNIKEILEKRRKGMIHFATDSGEEIVLIGKDYLEFHHSIGKEEKKHLETKEFEGATACTGIAIGKVRICTSLDTIHEFKDGEILVAPMTRPEYLPAMKKAAAIITDEGGITCHAAIISRELGIPCVIGTKIATNILKNGDLVEVNANHGLIIIRGEYKK